MHVNLVNIAHMNSGDIVTLTRDGRITFKISGILDFTLRMAFLSAMEAIDDKTESCNIDLSETISIDSSGLGMLLILKNHPKFKDGGVNIITKNNATITEIILNHNFHTIFKISS